MMNWLCVDTGRGQSVHAKLLDEMEAEGLIIKTRKERYAVPERMGLIVEISG